MPDLFVPANKDYSPRYPDFWFSFIEFTVYASLVS